MGKPRKVEFTGSEGQTLAGRLDMPSGVPRGYVLFAHCFTCSKDVFAASRVAGGLADRGFAVLRFDFTGLGHSQGEFANTNFSSNIEDLEAAATWMTDQGMAPDLLVGHSLGGAAVVVAAGGIPSVKAVATIAAPAHADHVTENFADDLHVIERDGEAEVLLVGRPFKIKKQFLDDVRGARVTDAAAALKRPLLVLHSPIDQTVGIGNATELFVAAKHPKSFVSLDNADHLLTRKEDAVFVADMIAAWAERHALSQAPAANPPKPAAGPRGVAVQETGRGLYENWVIVGEHRLLADEPEEYGGDDAGPDPYEWLNGALGACTSMTLRMYAERKGWPVAAVAVDVTHDKTHAEDCAHCDEAQAAHVDVFERSIRIEGDLTDEQRRKMMEIADKCPVHRTLHTPVVVRTREIA